MINININKLLKMHKRPEIVNPRKQGIVYAPYIIVESKPTTNFSTINEWLK